MEFKTNSTIKRPIRLSSKLRKWALESMRGKYGEDAKKTPCVIIDEESFSSLTNIEKYDYIIQDIAKKAPIRICDEEEISGSATLGMAIEHYVPATFKGEKIFYSVSHLTIDYKTTLTNGIDFYEQQIRQRLKDEPLSNEQVLFLNSLLNVINAMRIYHERYLNAVKDIKPQVYKNLLQVPFKPARNFHQAVQSIWFIFSFVRLCGNWPGIGRIDWLLGDYLKKDLQSGVLTKNRAREILASFFIKGTEWIQKNTPLSSGDAQHYQNIVLAGIDQNGNDITNEVTYLVLDIIEELGISDFPITVRVNKKTPNKLLNKVARVVRLGGGIVAIYNESLILKGLKNYGYSVEEVWQFANDGCWEVQIPGKTCFGYRPFDSLALLQKNTLNGYREVNFTSFEEFYNAYLKDLTSQVGAIYTDCLGDVNKDFYEDRPTSVVSLFTIGCIKNACAYNRFGPTYTVYSPHIGGVADTVNSLYAIKKLVFDEKKISFAKFIEALKNNWENDEELLLKVSKLSYYGTDNDEVDELYAKLLHDYYLICKSFDNKKYFLFPAGVSTFGREIEWRHNRLATPYGKKQGEILAGNNSPTPNTDFCGATAVIKSYCKADLSEMVTGAALDLKISPQTLTGKDGLEALKALVRGFVTLGGYFMQIDTVNAETLKKARENPAEYKTLSVRVSGWNARFITLTKEWQDMIIQRTEHNG